MDNQLKFNRAISPSVFKWSNSLSRLEHLDKIRRRGKSCALRYFGYGIISRQKLLSRRVKPLIDNIRAKWGADLIFYNSVNVVGMITEMGGYVGVCKSLLGEVIGNVGENSLA